MFKQNNPTPKKTHASKMHKLSAILLLGLILSIFTAEAQKIEGRVSSSNNRPIELAQITSLALADSSVIDVTITDSLGHFVLSNIAGSSSLMIQISIIGYFDTTLVFSTADNTFLNIELKEQIKELEEVNILASKPIIERKIDRIVFNVENSSLGKGFASLDVLRRIPRIEVSENDDIRLIGKSDLQVMIDGRIIPFTSNSLKAKLKSLRSDDIAQIEVITSPPAKYSANGNSGLINIITKKGQLLGFRNSVNLTAVQRIHFSILPTYSLAYKTRILDFSVSLSGYNDNKVYRNTNQIYFQEGGNRVSESMRNGNSKDLTLNTNLGIDISPKLRMGLITDHEYGNNNDKGSVNTVFHNVNTTEPYVNTTSAASTHYKGGNYTTYADYKIDSLGKKMNINTNYYWKTDDGQRMILDDNKESELDDVNNRNNIGYSGYSANIDFELPFKFGTFETGTSYAQVINENEFQNLNAEVGTLYPELSSNTFNYDESTIAAFLSYNKEINSKWSVKAGLRYEGTQIFWKSNQLNQDKKIRYDYFFPSMYLNWNCNESNSFNFAYNKRFERPYYYLLNPAPIFQSVFRFTVGNPGLLPSVSHNFEISHIFKGNLSTFLFLSHVGGGISDFASFLPDEETQKVEYYNHLDKTNAGLSIAYSFNSIRRLNSYNSFDYFTSYAVSSKFSNSLPSVRGSGLSISSSNNLSLDQDKRYLINLRYSYNFASTYNFYKALPQQTLDIGATLNLLSKKQLEISILLRDIFKTSINRGTMKYVLFSEYNRNYNDIRSLTVSVNYTFGNTKVNTNDKYILNMNKNRTIK